MPNGIWIWCICMPRNSFNNTRDMVQQRRKPTVESFCGRDYVVEHLRHGCSTIDKHYEVEYK